eukprot:GFYU01019402.1.p1 GENE.GFYU01019402.1~~GFYU01019402.1.p1  ORF type:complete len:258 (+),score=90.52 GFYU01019402.1:2-775(+)
MTDSRRSVSPKPWETPYPFEEVQHSEPSLPNLPSMPTVSMTHTTPTVTPTTTTVTHDDPTTTASTVRAIAKKRRESTLIRRVGDDWEELRDASGELFYYNTATGQCSYDIPSTLTAAAGESTLSAGGVGGVADMQRRRQSSFKRLVNANVEELVDVTSGETFYFDLRLNACVDDYDSDTDSMMPPSTSLPRGDDDGNDSGGIAQSSTHTDVGAFTIVHSDRGGDSNVPKDDDAEDDAKTTTMGMTDTPLNPLRKNDQ